MVWPCSDFVWVGRKIKFHAGKNVRGFGFPGLFVRLWENSEGQSMEIERQEWSEARISYLCIKLKILMSHRLFLFNPDHDMALANFTPYYQPPSEIIRMANDLSVLPLWYAGEGDKVKVDATERVESWHSPYFPFRCGWTEEWESLPCSPWGWNPALLHALRLGGIDASLLPSDDWVRRIRYLSGRQRCVEILHGFAEVPYTCGTAFVCRSLAEVRSLVGRIGKSVLKSPWSGSGRGLVRLDPASWNASTEGWVSRILRTQGEIMVEPLYDKVLDFAMEFYADGRGDVRFAGYSMFETDALGNYKANLLASDAEMERRLFREVPAEWIHEIRGRLLRELACLLAADYEGCLGVDMMVCMSGGRKIVHPCVEVNLRMNMGVVSRIIFDRYLHPYSTGRYVVEHYAADGDALAAHDEMTLKYPLDIVEGRIFRGYLSLTPVYEDTRYQIYVVAEAPLQMSIPMI